MILSDLRRGIVGRWRVLLLPAALYTVGALYCLRSMEFMGQEATFGTCLLTLLRGCEPAAREETFVLPPTWFILMSGPLLSTLFYPAAGMEGVGVQMLLRSGTRRRWWYSKCLWNFLSVGLYFAVGAACLALTCLLTQGPGALGWGGIDTLSWVTGEGLTAGRLTALLLGLPYLAVMALSLLEMVLSVCVHQVAAILVSEGILLWSAAMRTPLAIGNYTMASRCGELCGGGLSGSRGAVICAVVCGLCILLGGALFRRQDVLTPRNKGE